MPLRGKKEHSPFGYAVFKSLGALMKKTLKLSLALTLGMELSVRAVDAAADISGYDKQYTDVAPEIIHKMETEFNIDIPETQISTSFVDLRSIMMHTSYEAQKTFHQEYSILDYVKDYYRTTVLAVLMNEPLAKLLDQDETATAIYGNNMVGLAPFDNSTKLEPIERMVIAHESMHGYVNSVNPNMYKVRNREEYSVRLTVDEGLATFSSDYVYHGSSFIEMARIIAVIQEPNRINYDKFAQYTIGTNFVARAVDRMGFGAIELIAKNPPTRLEEIVNPDSYFDWLETNK